MVVEPDFGDDPDDPDESAEADEVDDEVDPDESEPDDDEPVELPDAAGGAAVLVELDDRLSVL